MSRNPDYEFFATDADALEATLTAAYEKITGATVQPGGPEKLFIKWTTSIILQERAQANYIGNQNIPSRAEGANLDALGELFFMTERPSAKAAYCTERFYISEPQPEPVMIPAGTRVTDTDKTLVWETTEAVTIGAGDSYADVKLQCQSIGAAGNDYALGQLNTIIDVFDYYASCENVSVSDGGADVMSDEDYYALLRASMDGYSTAGGMGNYIYHALAAASGIIDVVANSPSPGEVRLYVLSGDGEAAPAEVKAAVLSACNADTVRPLTDHVQMADPEQVDYDIDLTYWLSSDATISAAEARGLVEDAVNTYIAWQRTKLGRDVNPSRLIRELMAVADVKRVEVRAPVFTELRDGRVALTGTQNEGETAPQFAVAGNVTITSGGYEDE